MRTNIFYLIYKFYINNCRLRKETPSPEMLEGTMKFETKKIVLTNPANSDVVDQVLERRSSMYVDFCKQFVIYAYLKMKIKVSCF
jgi:hypothetical protein